MVNLPEDVAKVEAAAAGAAAEAAKAAATTEAWYSKAVTWVVGNAGKVVIGVVVLVAILVWKFL
jgi:hypothetical protein